MILALQYLCPLMEHNNLPFNFHQVLQRLVYNFIQILFKLLCLGGHLNQFLGCIETALVNIGGSFSPSVIKQNTETTKDDEQQQESFSFPLERHLIVKKDSLLNLTSKILPLSSISKKKVFYLFTSEIGISMQKNFQRDFSKFSWWADLQCPQKPLKYRFETLSVYLYNM